MASKVILVTGGTGMIGKALEKVLPEVGRSDESWTFVSSKDANLESEVETAALFKRYKPTHVIHLAAMVGGMFHNARSPLEYFRSNMKINDSVLHCCSRYGVKKCVSCLSTCIYPDKTAYPLDETMLHDGPPDDMLAGFCYAKRMLDVMNTFYNKQQTTCLFTSVIPTNLYGPHDNYNLEVGHVIPNLINKGLQAKKNNKPLVVWGSGIARRQFVYSLDMAKILVWVLREYDEICPINVSVAEEEEISIREIAEMVAEAYDLKEGIVFDTSKTDGQLKKTASTVRMRKYLPDFKFTPIREGIKESVEWFMKNYDTARK